MSTQHHESLSAAEEVPRASNRSVGLVLAIVCGVIGAWPVLSGADPRTWALGLACALIILALAQPRLLSPVAWAWLGLGQVLHVIVGPVVLGLVYVVAVIPTGLYVRITGKDPLGLKQDPNAASYWVPRDPPGPDPKSLSQQF